MSDLAASNRVVSLSSAANDFLAYAKALLLDNGTMTQALKAVEHHQVLAGPRITEILKSAIAAGTTADAIWAESLAPYRAVSNGFVSSLANFGAFDAIMNDGAFLRVPMKTRLAVTTVGPNVTEQNKAAIHLAAEIKELPKWATDKFGEQPSDGPANQS